MFTDDEVWSIVKEAADKLDAANNLDEKTKILNEYSEKLRGNVGKTPDGMEDFFKERIIHHMKEIGII